jgi:hypothetical protein
MRRRACGLAFGVVVAGAAPATAERPLLAQGCEVGRTGRAWQVFPLGGSCSLAVTPDRAVIVGGVAADALKPTEAARQLDAQIEAMRRVVEGERGSLALLERVRTVKSAGPGGDDRDLPVQVVQRLRATFPAGAAIDRILDRFIELGLDRFGDRLLPTGGSTRDAVIRFEVSTFDAKVAALRRRCEADAWTRWCAAPESEGACPGKQPPSDLALQSFTVRSDETLLSPDGDARYWSFTYTSAQRSARPPELLGNVVVHLRGDGVWTYRTDEAP